MENPILIGGFGVFFWGGGGGGGEKKKNRGVVAFPVATKAREVWRHSAMPMRTAAANFGPRGVDHPGWPFWDSKVQKSHDSHRDHSGRKVYHYLRSPSIDEFLHWHGTGMEMLSSAALSFRSKSRARHHQKKPEFADFPRTNPEIKTRPPKSATVEAKRIMPNKFYKGEEETFPRPPFRAKKSRWSAKRPLSTLIIWAVKSAHTPANAGRTPASHLFGKNGTMILGKSTWHRLQSWLPNSRQQVDPLRKTLFEQDTIDVPVCWRRTPRSDDGQLTGKLSPKTATLGCGWVVKIRYTDFFW